MLRKVHYTSYPLHYSRCPLRGLELTALWLWHDDSSGTVRGFQGHIPVNIFSYPRDYLVETGLR